jgi:hypothetical protein
LSLTSEATCLKSFDLRCSQSQSDTNRQNKLSPTAIIKTANGGPQDIINGDLKREAVETATLFADAEEQTTSGSNYLCILSFIFKVECQKG